MTDNSTDRVEVSFPHDVVADFVEAYEFDSDECYHVPTENERALITDAIHGFISEHRLAALSGAGGNRPTQDDIYAAFYAESAVLDEARAGAQVLTIAQFGAAVDRLLATHPGDHPGDAGFTDKQVAEAMQEAWDGFCDDAGAHPDDIYRQGRKTFFKAGRWAAQTAAHLRYVLHRDSILSPTSAPAGDGARREAIARIIKGVRFKDRFGNDYRADDERLDHTELDAADRILALSTQATDREKVLEEAAQIVEAYDTFRENPHQAAVLDVMQVFCAERIRALAQAPSEEGDNRVELYPELEAELARMERPEDGGLIVRDERTGRPYTPSYQVQLHRRIRKEAKLPSDLKFTSFRHGGITELGDSGEVDVRAVSGHKTLNVTGIYNKTTDEKARRIAARRREHIAAITAGSALDEEEEAPDSGAPE